MRPVAVAAMADLLRTVAGSAATLVPRLSAGRVLAQVRRRVRTRVDRLLVRPSPLGVLTVASIVGSTVLVGRDSEPTAWEATVTTTATDV